MESTIVYTFTPCVGYFTSPGIHQIEEINVIYNVSSERHRQCGVNELDHVSKRRSNHGATTPHKRYTVFNVESQVFTPNITFMVRGCANHYTATPLDYITAPLATLMSWLATLRNVLFSWQTPHLVWLLVLATFSKHSDRFTVNKSSQVSEQRRWDANSRSRVLRSNHSPTRGHKTINIRWHSFKMNISR